MQIRIQLEGEEEFHTISDVPTSYEELCTHVYRTTGATSFKLKFHDRIIKTSKDLIIAYLENQDDILNFIVDEDLVIPGYMGSSMDQLMQTPAEKFVPENGIVSKEQLLQLVGEMTEQAKTRLVQSNKEFMSRRQEFYGTDDTKWREIAFAQLSSQEKLLFAITGEVCRKHDINP